MGIDPHLRLTCRPDSLTQPLALIWKQVWGRHGPFPEKAGDNVTVEAFRKKCLWELMQIKRAWPELNYTTERAMAAHSPSDTGADPQVESRTPTPECAPYASTALLRFSPGDCWASSLAHSRPCPILHSGLWLPPAARLALDPLGRRKPAARTLLLAQRGVCQHALPMPPLRGPALGSASSSRCRVWPLPPVPGERQTLTNP